MKRPLTLLDERRAANPALDKSVQGFLEAAARMRSEAEEQARKSNYEGAIKTLEDSTRELVRAIEGVHDDTAPDGVSADVVLDRTPFYAEGGGQDLGMVTANPGRVGQVIQGVEVLGLDRDLNRIIGDLKARGSAPERSTTSAPASISAPTKYGPMLRAWILSSTRWWSFSICM